MALSCAFSQAVTVLSFASPISCLTHFTLIWIQLLFHTSGPTLWIKKNPKTWKPVNKKIKKDLKNNYIKPKPFSFSFFVLCVCVLGGAGEKGQKALYSLTTIFSNFLDNNEYFNQGFEKVQITRRFCKTHHLFLTWK